MSNRAFVIEAEGFPDLPGMMLASVNALKSIGGSATIHELDEKVAEIEGVSEEEQSFMMAGTNHNQPRLNDYLAWARTYLKRVGAIENSSRGVWALTEIGNTLTSLQDAKSYYERVVEEEKVRARERRAKLKGDDDAPEAAKNFPDEKGKSESPETRPWKAELLEVLKRMDPSAFERLAQRLLREAGFTKVEVRGKSGDGGIDGVGVLRVNLVSFQVFFQCKRWIGSVGSSEIRDFRGAMMGRADKGLFITTGTFTAQASVEATRDGATAIDLIDGDRLCELLKENGVGVSTQKIEVVAVDEGFFASM